MKIVIFDDDYPDAVNLPGDMFAHTRAREYAKTSSVLVLRRAQGSRGLSYEGIDICDYNNSVDALNIIYQFNPDVVAVHFATEPFISEVAPYLNRPLFVWVHGYEALAWHRRTFNMLPGDWLPHRLYRRNLSSKRRLESFSKLIDRSNLGEKIHFIFVSQWMKSVCEADVNRTVSNYSIISNPIDTDRFNHSPIEGRLNNLLVIRSCSTMKYSPDIVAGVVRLLAKSRMFRCRIFGDGALFNKYYAPLATFPNVEVHRGFLSQDQIIEQHKWGGIFICPTRQDAQGVSMCEAMASGLIVATNPVTAIPEFVTQEIAILERSASRLSREIIKLSLNPQKASRMSEAAAMHISSSLAVKNICDRELDLMKTSA